MTLFSYEIFDAVARQGSFNKAAQQLHLTPSAISHAIAVMEEELGFALFNRGKNGVSMTSYGASLYPSIRAVLNSDEALKQSIARLNGLEKGKVKLGAFNSVCASLLPGLLKSFAAQYPQIEIEVYQGTYDDVKEWLRTGQVDIAFLSSTCKEEFNLTELFREPLLCIVPQDWPEPQDGVMTPALMNGQSFVVQCDATDAEMRQFLKKYKISTERRCHVIDDQSNIAMVEAGLGISIMPQMLLRDCKAAVKVDMTAANIHTFEVCAFYVPLDLIVLSLLVFMFKVKINEKMHAEIVEQLEAKLAAGEIPDEEVKTVETVEASTRRPRF